MAKTAISTCLTHAEIAFIERSAVARLLIRFMTRNAESRLIQIAGVSL